MSSDPSSNDKSRYFDVDNGMCDVVLHLTLQGRDEGSSAAASSDKKRKRTTGAAADIPVRTLHLHAFLIRDSPYFDAIWERWRHNRVVDGRRLVIREVLADAEDLEATVHILRLMYAPWRTPVHLPLDTQMRMLRLADRFIFPRPCIVSIVAALHQALLDEASLVHLYTFPSSVLNLVRHRHVANAMIKKLVRDHTDDLCKVAPRLLALTDADKYPPSLVTVSLAHLINLIRRRPSPKGAASAAPSPNDPANIQRLLRVRSFVAAGAAEVLLSILRRGGADRKFCGRLADRFAVSALGILVVADDDCRSEVCAAGGMAIFARMLISLSGLDRVIALRAICHTVIALEEGGSRQAGPDVGSNASVEEALRLMVDEGIVGLVTPMLESPNAWARHCSSRFLLCLSARPQYRRQIAQTTTRAFVAALEFKPDFSQVTPRPVFDVFSDAKRSIVAILINLCGSIEFFSDVGNDSLVSALFLGLARQYGASYKPNDSGQGQRGELEVRDAWVMIDELLGVVNQLGIDASVFEPSAAAAGGADGPPHALLGSPSAIKEIQATLADMLYKHSRPARLIHASLFGLRNLRELMQLAGDAEIDWMSSHVVRIALASPTAEVKLEALKTLHAFVRHRGCV